MDEEVCYDADNDFDATTSGAVKHFPLNRKEIADIIIPSDEIEYFSSLSHDAAEKRREQHTSPSSESEHGILLGSPKSDMDSLEYTPDVRKKKYPPIKGKKVSFSRYKYIASDENLLRKRDQRHNANDAYENNNNPLLPGPINTELSSSSDPKCFIIESIDSTETPRSAVSSINTNASKPRTPRRKKELTAASYETLLTDTSNIAPSKIRYSVALNKHRSLDRMVHPVEKHHMNALSLHSLHSIYKNETPSKTFAHEFDYVIVFPYIEKEEKGQSPDAKYIMHAMLLSGLELFPYLSVSGKELFVLIRAPTAVLQLLAEKSEISFPTNPTVLKDILLRGDKANRIAPVRIRHEPLITPIEPYQHIYLKYRIDIDQRLYHVIPRTPLADDASARDSVLSFLQSDYNQLFPKNIRLKLILFLLTAPRRLGGCNLEISRLLLRRKILSIFPLHEADISQEILNHVIDIRTMPWNIPIQELRNYLGEKIALYMVFVGHMSYWLIPPAIIGVILQVIVWVTGNYSHPSVPIFTVFMMLWTVIMLRFWKREQSYTSLQWGMTEYVAKQYERPEFIGELQLNSYINGKEMLYFPRNDFRSRIALSLMAILAFVILVIGVITGIYLLRYFVSSSLGSVTTFIAAFLNVIEILSLNLLYQFIAVKLTNQENHRTDTEYEDALIIKVFVFQFINSYASLFFLAFIAQNLPQHSVNSSSHEDNHVGQCGDINCMRPLALSLGLIIITRTLFKNFMDLLFPYLNYVSFLNRRNKNLNNSKHKKLLTPPEMDFLLMEYDTILENVRKYSDTAVQYGYTVLFLAALPVAPLFTIIYNYLKVKFQCWKMLMLFQRPPPTGAQSIESWQTIFSLISVIAVISNAGIITVTMDVLSGYSYFFRVWIFIGFQWCLLTCQYAAYILIPSEPEMVQIQKSRMAFIHEKVILKYPDEDFDVQQYNLADEDEGDDNDPINNNYANQEERKIMNDPHYIIPFSHPSHSLSYDMPRDYPPIRPLKISPRSNASTENTQGGINGGSMDYSIADNDNDNNPNGTSFLTNNTSNFQFDSKYAEKDIPNDFTPKQLAHENEHIKKLPSHLQGKLLLGSDSFEIKAAPSPRGLLKNGQKVKSSIFPEANKSRSFFGSVFGFGSFYAPSLFGSTPATPSNQGNGKNHDSDNTNQSTQTNASPPFPPHRISSFGNNPREDIEAAADLPSSNFIFTGGSPSSPLSSAGSPTNNRTSPSHAQQQQQQPHQLRRSAALSASIYNSAPAITAIDTPEDMMTNTLHRKNSNGRMYLKRLPYGFYEQEEMLTPWQQMWRGVSDLVTGRLFHSIAEDCADENHSGKGGGSDGSSKRLSRDVENIAQSLSIEMSGKPGHDVILKRSHSYHHHYLPSSSISPGPSGKRMYRQRLRYNDESVNLRLSSLEIMNYPNTEDLKQWKPPISKDIVEYDPEFDLFKLDI